MTLDNLLQQLKSAHGDRLLGVVLYGSTATDPAATKGHNIVVVVATLDVVAMQAAGAIARAWESAGNAAPLTLTQAEWISSVDVFAIEHADISDRNRVLHSAGGFALTARAGVRNADIRHQLEYELLAVTLAVRTAIASAGGNVSARRSILAGQASRAVALMRAALRLAGRDAVVEAEGVCAAAAELAGFDANPFLAALKQRRGQADVAKADLDAATGGFHTGLAKLLRWVDAQGSTAAAQ
ncbi:MAG: hypothetical protein O2973_11105 [Gemmatimonadetes bacterium]|nr:hypothetical protein [Gemmatimonadota bacterium]